MSYQRKTPVLILITGLFVLGGSTETLAARCRANSVRSTMYYVPHARDFGGVTAKFRAAVRMQGTGTIGPGRVLRYNGRTERLPAGCETAVGAAGRCLMPFFSIAADRRHFRMGDIIHVPEMAGKRVYLPAPQNRTVIHPGYFMVDDVGGAIRGPNRFDFFTGSMGMNHRNNVFGIKAPRSTNMSDKNSCNKTFTVVRQGTAKWRNALAQIRETYSGRGTMRLADRQDRPGSR